MSSRFVLLGAGTALLGVLLWRLGPVEILDTLGRIGWYFAPILLLGAAHHATRALALNVCILQPGRLRYRDALAIRLSGEAVQTLTLTGPVLAEPTKAWLLERRGLTFKEGFAATITEYLVYSFVSAAMAILGLVVLLQRFAPGATIGSIAQVIIALCTVFLVASVIAIARRYYLIGTIVSALVRTGVLRGRLRPEPSAVNAVEDLLLQVLHDAPSRLALVIALEIIAQALLVSELFWLLRAIHVGVPGSWVFLIEAWAKFFDFVFLLVPLQVGVLEGTYASIFGVMGLPLSGGFVLAFVRRARSLAIAGAGLAMLALLTRRQGRGARFAESHPLSSRETSP
jgi:lysylphosphatidylglycerol synthase-like protein